MSSLRYHPRCSQDRSLPTSHSNHLPPIDRRPHIRPHHRPRPTPRAPRPRPRPRRIAYPEHARPGLHPPRRSARHRSRRAVRRHRHHGRAGADRARAGGRGAEGQGGGGGDSAAGVCGWDGGGGVCECTFFLFVLFLLLGGGKANQE